MHPDRFNNLTPVEAARAAMQVVTELQKFHSKEAQVHGITAAFVLYLERFDLDAQDVVTKTKNLMSFVETRRPEFNAVAMYLQEEL